MGYDALIHHTDPVFSGNGHQMQENGPNDVATEAPGSTLGATTQVGNPSSIAQTPADTTPIRSPHKNPMYAGSEDWVDQSGNGNPPPHDPILQESSEVIAQRNQQNSAAEKADYAKKHANAAVNPRP